MMHQLSVHTLRTQLQELWDLKRREDPPLVGICSAARLDYRFKFLTVEWPESTGNKDFPVPVPAFEVIATADIEGWGSRYEAAYWTLDKWTGEYGSSRIRLLNYLIRRIERELNERIARGEA